MTTCPYLELMVRVRFKVRYRVMVRVKNRVLVGIVFRFRVWFYLSI